jgi:hypothetical protein
MHGDADVKDNDRALIATDKDGNAQSPRWSAVPDASFTHLLGCHSFGCQAAFIHSKGREGRAVRSNGT